MTLLFPTPQSFDLPLSKGGDLFFVFIYKPVVVDEDGEPVLLNGSRQYVEADYPDGATVALTVDMGAVPVVVDGDIAGSRATFWEDKAVADTVAAKKLWRVVLTFEDGLDKVLCNGETVRSDGKKK